MKKVLQKRKLFVFQIINVNMLHLSKSVIVDSTVNVDWLHFSSCWHWQPALFEPVDGLHYQCGWHPEIAALFILPRSAQTPGSETMTLTLDVNSNFFFFRYNRHGFQHFHNYQLICIFRCICYGLQQWSFLLLQSLLEAFQSKLYAQIGCSDFGIQKLQVKSGWCIENR